MSATEEDDFAKQLNLEYPPLVFKDLRVPDDAEMMKPIVMVMYALTMNDPTDLPLGRFERLTKHNDGLHYTLSAHFPDNSTISFKAWYALMTVTPTRIKAIHVQPYFDVSLSVPRLRVMVDMSSILAPLTSSFDGYLRKDRHFLVPNHPALVEVPIESVARRDYISEIRHECRSMTRVAQDYVFDQNFIADSATMTIQWRLPIEQTLDIAALFVLVTKFTECLKEVSVGMRVVNDGLEGFRPIMQVVVNMELVSHRRESSVLIDTKTMLFFTDTTKTSEPWYFEASGPLVPSSSAGTNTNNNRNVRRQDTRRAAAVKPSVDATVDRVQTRRMAEMARKPTNKKRQRPASMQHPDISNVYDADTDMREEEVPNNNHLSEGDDQITSTNDHTILTRPTKRARFEPNEGVNGEEKDDIEIDHYPLQNYIDASQPLESTRPTLVGWLGRLIGLK